MPSNPWSIHYRAFCGVRNIIGEIVIVANRAEVPMYITAGYAVLLGIARNFIALVAAVDCDNCVTAAAPVELDPAGFQFALFVELDSSQTILGRGEAGEKNGADDDERTHFGCARSVP